MNYIIFFSLLLSVLNGEIHVFNRQSGMESSVRTLSSSKPLYASAKELAGSLTSKMYENTERKKLVLYIGSDKIKISGNSSYVIINDKPFQMARTIRVESNKLYIPTKDFVDIFRRSISDLVDAGGKNDYFEAAIQPLLDKLDTHFIDISEYPCLEIDFLEDLESARELFKDKR